MARSLKTSYLLLALGVSAVLALILGGLAYYEHRVNTFDANQLTYATVEQKLEADLEARAKSLSNITSTSLIPALKEGNNAAVAAVAARLLDERDIERVELWGAHNEILYSGSNPEARPTSSGPYVLRTELPHLGNLEIWMSRARNAGNPLQHPLAIAEQAGNADQAHSRRVHRHHRAALHIGAPGRMADRPPAVGADCRAGEERRSHRRRRLHAAARRSAPGRTRRSAIRAGAHAAEPERNHDHQELPQYRAQQLERRGIRHLAGRHRQKLQRSRATAARPFIRGNGRQAAAGLHR